MIKSLRLVALGVSLLLLIVMAPVIMLGLAFPGEEVLSVWEQVAFIAGVPLLLTSGFIFVFAYGGRIVNSAILRLISAILLSFPIIIAALLLSSGHSEFWPVAIPLQLFSVLLFSVFVFPAWLKRASHQFQRTPTDASE